MISVEIFNSFCAEGKTFHGLETRIKMEIKGFFKEEKEAEYFVLLESDEQEVWLQTKIDSFLV